MGTNCALEGHVACCRDAQHCPARLGECEHTVACCMRKTVAAAYKPHMPNMNGRGKPFYLVHDVDERYRA